MSEMKHTPGPWKVKIGDGDIEVVHRIGAVTTVVATIHGHNHLPVIIADAYMVAAAPQLLEASDNLALELSDGVLEMMRECLGNTNVDVLRDKRDAVIAAIAAAEGAG